MSYNNGPRIVTDGLVLTLDAGNAKSYVGSGTTWNDLSGNGNNGTLTNGPTFNSTNGGSIVFDGIDDYVVTTSTTFTANTSFTYEIFCKSDNFIAQRNIFGNKSYYSTGQGAQFTNGASPQQVVGIIRTDVATYDISTAIGPTYNWTQFVIRRAENLMQMFINGNLLATTRTISGSIADASDKFWVGAANGGGSSWWSGNIGNIKVYNRALTTQEVLQNFNATRSRFGV